MKVGPKSGIRLAAIIAMALCWVTAPADASIISVTNTNDSGPGSLRQALAIANVGDYSGIASTNGVVVPLWADIRSGSNQDAYIVHAGGATATTTPTATATATCPPGAVWSIRPETYPPPAYLYGVSAVSANDAWAVGYYLAQHWDGSSWSRVSLPTPGSGSNSLHGVAVISANDVWAVGAFNDSGGPQQTLTEHWNGSTWSVVPSPNQGTTGSELHAVAAISSNDVWAVGWYSCCQPINTLIEHWDGTQWSIVPSPSPGIWENYLYGVSAVSSNDVWAVGWYRNSNNTPEFTMALHWNGTAWSAITIPTPGYNSVLQGVTAVSSNDVWAAGFFEDTSPGTQQTLTEHWDGSTWTIVPSPNAGPTQNFLFGVSAASSNDVWAVGWYWSGSFTHPESLHWNGSSWNVVPVPDPGGLYNELRGVAAVSSNDVWAVGWSNYSTRTGVSLIEHYGLCATVTATPTPTLTPTPTATSTPTITPIPTSTPTPTPTPRPTPSPRSSPLPRARPTPPPRPTLLAR